MRALLILVAAMMVGLAGGYAWSTTGAKPAARTPPKAAIMALPPSPDEQPAELDRQWAARSAPEDSAPADAASGGSGDGSVHYPGCNAVRAAGKAPLYEGDPGYRIEMDGDADGIACEPIRNR